MHRVVNRSTDTPRVSIVTFCNCDFGAVVETIAAEAGGGGGGGGQTYPPIKAGEYILEKLGLMY